VFELHVRDSRSPASETAASAEAVLSEMRLSPEFETGMLVVAVKIASDNSREDIARNACRMVADFAASSDPVLSLAALRELMRLWLVERREDGGLSDLLEYLVAALPHLRALPEPLRADDSKYFSQVAWFAGAQAGANGGRAQQLEAAACFELCAALQTLTANGERERVAAALLMCAGCLLSIAQDNARAFPGPAAEGAQPAVLIADACVAGEHAAAATAPALAARVTACCAQARAAIGELADAGKRANFLSHLAAVELEAALALRPPADAARLAARFAQNDAIHVSALARMVDCLAFASHEHSAASGIGALKPALHATCGAVLARSVAAGCADAKRLDAAVRCGKRCFESAESDAGRRRSVDLIVALSARQKAAGAPAPQLPGEDLAWFASAAWNVGVRLFRHGEGRTAGKCYPILSSLTNTVVSLAFLRFTSALQRVGWRSHSGLHPPVAPCARRTSRA
jgi:hypothetical protein